jgi:pimeloyl-ACP methyl ester carboxylesterase
METVVSKDGTSIAYQRQGSGPSLVLVYGTSSVAARWRMVLPRLTEHFSVYAMERRGHGESGDTPPYAVAREAEDIATLVESIAGPVDLLGHSHGGLCSLEAALLCRNLRRLILYEPPVRPAGAGGWPTDVLQRLQALADAGRLEDLLVDFLGSIGGRSEHQVGWMKSQPDWGQRVQAAGVIPRELLAHNQYVFDPTRFRGLTALALLMVGGASSDGVQRSTEWLHEALFNSRVVVLPKQGHVAMETAPEMFADEVIRFLS